MVVLLHGAAGGWDELAIAVAALAVLWVAVKLAGRKGKDDDVEDDVEEVDEEVPETSATPAEQAPDPAQSSPTTRG